MIHIYYRSSLNMTRGKITSQCAHALVGFYLGTIDREHRTWRHPSASVFWDQEQDIELIPVDDDTFAHLNGILTITDQGRTMFNGVLTDTVTITCDRPDITAVYQPNPHVQEDGTYQTRQMIAVNREEKNKKTLAKDGVMAALKAVQKDVQVWMLGAEKLALEHWWNNSFAKITVQLKTSEDLQLMHDCVQHGSAYATPPLFIDECGKYRTLTLF